MSWTWAILIIVLCGVIGGVLRVYRQDRQRERARVRDVLSAEVLAELEQERAAAVRRKERFAEALKDADSEKN